jgi:hypothetical protein
MLKYSHNLDSGEASPCTPQNFGQGFTSLKCGTFECELGVRDTSIPPLYSFDIGGPKEQVFWMINIQDEHSLRLLVSMSHIFTKLHGWDTNVDKVSYHCLTALHRQLS